MGLLYLYLYLYPSQYCTVSAYCTGGTDSEFGAVGLTTLKEDTFRLQNPVCFLLLGLNINVLKSSVSIVLLYFLLSCIMNRNDFLHPDGGLYLQPAVLGCFLLMGL
jgi:hypothetical protein